MGQVFTQVRGESDCSIVGGGGSCYRTPSVFSMLTILDSVKAVVTMSVFIASVITFQVITLQAIK